MNKLEGLFFCCIQDMLKLCICVCWTKSTSLEEKIEVSLFEEEGKGEGWEEVNGMKWMGWIRRRGGSMKERDG